MAFSFKSILSDVVAFFKKPAVVDVEKIAMPALEDVFPAATPLITGLAAVAGKVEYDAATIGTAVPGAGKLAAALALGEQFFNDYEAARGVTIPAEAKTSIVNSVVSILNSLPASTAPVGGAAPAAAKA